MSAAGKDAPWGLSLAERISSKCCSGGSVDRSAWHRGGVLALTYIAYTCYHMTRKPISVWKNVVQRNCSALSPPPYIFINDSNRETWCDWAPFDTSDASALLGTLDSAFLFAYAAAMFLSGFVAERTNLRYFLSLGMLFSGISCYLFGIAKSYDIHNLWYFVSVQVMGGIFQTSGWPGVVTVVGNWFGKGKRGLIFGAWNSHTSLGNILGTLIAAEFVETDWSLSFVVPGVAMGLCGFIVFLMLAPRPCDAGCASPAPLGYRKLEATDSSDDAASGCEVAPRLGGHDAETPPVRSEDDDTEAADGRSETSPMLAINQRPAHRSCNNERAIGFAGAVKIPGVIEYSLALFFAKLVSYTFLYWLPLYIKASTRYGASLSADVSTLFDVGGIAGAVAAGLLSDWSGMSATTCAGLLLATVPTLFLYDYVGSTSLALNITLLLIAGMLVNGPYALITTAVSADLGTHPSLGDDSKALATVTAIIDGTGSIGAAVGPLLAGLVSRWRGWHSVFYMLMAADVLALLFLSRLVYKDLRMYSARRSTVLFV